MAQSTELDVVLTNVYVKNLTEDVDDEDLHEMFKMFGRILSAKVIKAPDGRKRGCGFVSFTEPESAKKAVEEMNGKEVNGKTLHASYAQRRAERQAELRREFEQNNIESSIRYEGLNLYVKNLEDAIDDERLHKEFSHFGTITSAKVMTDNGKSKGFGFVCFTKTEDALRAMSVMNGRIIVKKPLYVAMAQRKEDRKAHLATQYMQRVATMRMQAQQMDQMCPVTGAAYYIPTMPEGMQQNFFTPRGVPQMGAGLSWHAVGPNHASEGVHQNMLVGPQVRPADPVAPVQTSMHPNVSMSAMIRHNASQPWSSMPVMQNNMSGQYVSMPSQQMFPYSVNMFTMTGQNSQPWVNMALTQNNVSGHPIAANAADAENFQRPVISPSPPQRPLSIPPPPWSLPSSPRSLSPSPLSLMRFLAPPPRLPAEYLRPRLPMAQPVASGMPRHTESFNYERTASNARSNVQ